MYLYLSILINLPALPAGFDSTVRIISLLAIVVGVDTFLMAIFGINTKINNSLQ
jgi:hypothetical protein